MTSTYLKKKNFLSKLINYSSGTFFHIPKNEIFQMKKLHECNFTLPSIIKQSSIINKNYNDQLVLCRRQKPRSKTKP